MHLLFHKRLLVRHWSQCWLHRLGCHGDERVKIKWQHKEKFCHSEIQQEEVTRFPLSTEPCLPGFPSQIRSREGVSGLSILSQSCLDDCQCVRTRGNSLWYCLSSLHSLPLSHGKWHRELWVVYYRSCFPHPRACKEMLPPDSVLTTHIGTSQSLHGLETSCPSETQWLVLTWDERLTQAGCAQPIAQKCTVLDRGDNVHVASDLPSSLWLCSCHRLEMWLVLVTRPDNTLPLLLCEDF